MFVSFANYVYFLDQFFDYQAEQIENKGLTTNELIEKYLKGESAAYFKAKKLSIACKRGKAKREGENIKSFIENNSYETYNDVLRLVYNEVKGLQVGMDAPNFTLSDIDGEEVNLSELKGKVVYLTHENMGHRFQVSPSLLPSLKFWDLKVITRRLIKDFFCTSHHASTNHQDIIICSPDTDLFIIVMYAKESINKNIFFAAGTLNKMRIININAVNAKWKTIAKALPGLHAFTGNNITNIILSRFIPLKEWYFALFIVVNFDLGVNGLIDLFTV